MTLADVLGVESVTRDGKDAVPVSELAKNDAVGIYFSAHWCPPCRGFTPSLVEAYEKLKKDGKKFEIIFASSDRDQGAFDEYFAEMPWTAIPYENRKAKNSLSAKYKVQGIPTLVILDGEGNLMTKDGRSKVGDLESFPWTPPTFEESIGTEFIGNGGVKTTYAESLQDKVYGIYFSAHWCPPCKMFTPQLVKTYNKIKETHPDFQIVFASSDRDQDAFDEYFAEMPWLAIPYEDRKRKNKLSEYFEVSGIPTFVMMRGSTVINANARGRVSGDTECKEFPWEPKLVNDLSDGPEGINENPSLVVLMENLNIAEKSDLENKLLKIAADSKKQGSDMIFFTGKSGGDGTVTQRIRELTNIGDAKEQAQLLILDIGDEGAYYVSDKGASEDVISEFVSGFKDGKLQRKQLG